ncbi:hypothetical protein J2X57_000075 [Luteibacter sp. 1214]|uniref:hypothetical protein n=1 Tax=Luteibacter sp. 1214 TaxID=2817735 RepID=UPI002861E951|nr:hypothetical protein [Luteibacter sp. 1214]MDR6640881.1 hypothetical protein [Luteibacter sp. 1214]
MYLPPSLITYHRLFEPSMFEAASRLQKRPIFDGRSGDFHDVGDEDPERTVVKTYVVAPDDSPAWAFDVETLLNSVDEATEGGREALAHHAWISMPNGYDEDRAARLTKRVASYVAWRFNVPVSVTLCHEWNEPEVVEGKSEPRRCAEFSAELIFPARELAARGGREGDQADRRNFVEKSNEKMSKKVRKAIEVLVEEADHDLCADRRVRFT